MNEQDYNNAEKAFLEYTSQYDLTDGMVKLKVVHTFHVVRIAEMIAKDLKLSQEDIVLAKLCALLHDIGRFEQIRRYHTFYDSKSVNHGMLGSMVLRQDDLLRKFIPDPSYDELVLKTVENHNRFAIEDGLDSHTLLHAKIVRDADKTDIFRVRAEDPLEDTVGHTKEEMEQSTITPIVFEEFMKDHVVLSRLRKTPLDGWVSATAFIYDFNYLTGLKILQKEKRIDQTINKINYQDPKTKDQMNQIHQHANAYIDKKISAEIINQ